MADTEFNDPSYTDVTSLQAADIMLLLRGAGGINAPVSTLVHKQSDGKFHADAEIVGTSGTFTGQVKLSGNNAYYLGAPTFGHRFNNSANTLNLLILTESGAVKAPSIGTTASAANAFLNSGDGNSLLRSTSSLRYKTDIEDVEPERALRIVRGLRPIWYRSKAEADNPDWGYWGFGAEEAAEVDPTMVHWTYPESAWTKPNKDGERRLKQGAKPTVADGFQYDRLPVHHNVVINDLLDRMEALEARIAELEAATAA